MYEIDTFNAVTVRDKSHFIRYFLQIKASKSVKTANAYERDIQNFFRVAIENISLDDIRKVTIFDCQEFIRELTIKGESASTINRKISALSSLYRWLLKYQDNTTGLKVIQFNPFGNLKEEKPIINNKETPFLTQDEAKQLLDSIETKTILGLRNKTIIALAITTALRKAEIINIKIQDITTYDGYDVIKVTRKGGKQDFVKLQTPVRLMIEDYLRRTNRTKIEHSGSYLFLGHSTNGLNRDRLNESTLNYMIAKVAKKAGIEKDLRVHSTRHTAITLAINAGATIEKVRDFAGHKNISTTSRYVHSIERLKNNAGDLINII
ncbi:MAG: tyrosine-type recombinase/integrase [Clostridia bacterium]|nr:tyrosine-type recombinase/integrase [Clostridia bacterium]